MKFQKPNPIGDKRVRDIGCYLKIPNSITKDVDIN